METKEYAQLFMLFTVLNILALATSYDGENLMFCFVLQETDELKIWMLSEKWILPLDNAMLSV